jgi:beta-1,4-N-acetylglucosaminyltransferase
MRRARGPRGSPVDVLLVCSAGGHLLQLRLLDKAWAGLPHVWVTHNREDARTLLTGEPVIFGYWPTTRNVMNLVKNLVLAVRLVATLRPRAIVTTGAAIAVPFAWVGRLFGAEVVYIESLSRVDSPSLSCRLIRPVAGRVYVQWRELAEALPGSRYTGSVVS